MRFRHLSFLLIILFLTSCHPLFCIWNLGYENVQPSINREDLTGIYNLDKKSMAEMKYNYNYNISTSRLELKKDSTYEFKNLPDCALNVFGESEGHLINKNGKWRLGCDETYGCELIMSEVLSTAARKNNKLAILINIGDPDECIGLVYVKAP